MPEADDWRVAHMKKCSKCKAWRTLDQFCKRAAGKDGLFAWCKACTRANSLKYNAARRDEQAAKSRAYYNKNTGDVRSYQRGYRAANRDKELARVRKWQTANPDKTRVIKLRRRARKKENETFVVTAKEIECLLARPCYLCGVAPSTTVDHIIPVAKRGRHSVGNLIGACKSCNNGKYDKYLVEYRRYLRGL